MADVSRAERLAIRFHQVYEQFAPEFGYETRKESAKPWAEVPEQNRKLMVAVCAQLLSECGENPDLPSNYTLRQAGLDLPPR